MPPFIRKRASEKYYQSNLINWDETKAFRFKMYGAVDGIVINQKGRQDNGTIEIGDEYEQLRDEIIEKLLQAKDFDTGQRVVAEAFKREDLYKGDFLGKAPDIIIRLESGHVGGVGLEESVITSVENEIRETLAGIHDQNGIFIFKGTNLKKGKIIDDINIIDITPTLLYDLGLLIPTDIDGKIIMDVSLESYRTNLPKYHDTKVEDEDTKETLSYEDEEEMKKALRSLGNLE